MNVLWREVVGTEADMEGTVKYVAIVIPHTLPNEKQMGSMVRFVWKANDEAKRRGEEPLFAQPLLVGRREEDGTFYEDYQEVTVTTPSGTTGKVVFTPKTDRAAIVLRRVKEAWEG